MISLHVGNENDDTDEVEQPPHTITKTKSRMNRARDVMWLELR